MGGGFRFRYRSAYAKKTQPMRVSQQKGTPKLTQTEINEAMNQLLDRPTSTRRQMITKPVGVDFDSDFQKMASAEETVKNALRLLSSIQKLQKPEVEKDVLTLGVLSGANSNRDLLHVAKYKTTAEANNFISNATLQQTPDSSATPGQKQRAGFERKNDRRPQSSVYPSGVKARPMELDRMAIINQADDRQACGTLTPHSDMNRQEKSVKVFNQLLEVQSSQKSKKRLIKSNSNTTKNADIEDILKMNEPQLASNAEITGLQILSAAPIVSEVPLLFTTGDTRTPFSVNEDSNKKEVKQNAMASQTPPQNQLPIQILSERQIGYPALVSNKTNFSQIAWNISLMRQDSYDPTSSKDLLTFHHSERMLKTPVAVVPELRNGQFPIRPIEQSENEDGRLIANKMQKKNRPLTSRPAVVNLNSHNNIQKVFMQQNQEREIIRTLSTAQINKLSAGALQRQSKVSVQNLTKLPPQIFTKRNNQDYQAGVVELKARRPTIRGSLSQVQLESPTCQRDQPVKVKFLLQPIKEKGFLVQPLQQQSSALMNVTGVKLATIDTVIDQRTISSQQHQAQTPQYSVRFGELIPDTGMVQHTEVDSGREYQPTSELVQPSIKSRISVQSKASPKQGNLVKSKFEITKHLDHNLHEVETLKKVSDVDKRDNHKVTAQIKKSTLAKNSGATTTENQSAVEHRTSTIHDIDTNMLLGEKEFQQPQKLMGPTAFANLCPDLPSETIQISAFGSTLSKVNFIPEHAPKTPKIKQKFSPFQRKSFNENIANLARLISSQSAIDQVAFDQKYTNLMEKHTKKSWLPNPEPKCIESKTKNTTDITMKEKTKTANNAGNQKLPLPTQLKSHALAFLDLKSLATGSELFSGIGTVRVSRPQTTKSANRVAILQQRQAPLPPPSAKDRRRIGTDINFLRLSAQKTSKVGSVKQLVDIGKSNFQLLMKNTDLNICDEVSDLAFENNLILKGNVMIGSRFNGKSRSSTTNSNLFTKAKAKQKNQQVITFQTQEQH